MPEFTHGAACDALPSPTASCLTLLFVARFVQFTGSRRPELLSVIEQLALHVALPPDRTSFGAELRARALAAAAEVRA